MDMAHIAPRHLSLALVIGLLATGTAEAAEQARSNPTVDFYADTFGVSKTEAADRLQRILDAGQLKSRMERELPETFAGMYVQHFPDLSFRVRFTGDAESQLRRFTTDAAFVAEQAPRSLELLESVQAEIADQLLAAGEDFESSIDIKASTLQFRVLELKPDSLSRLRGLLDMFKFIKVMTTDSLPEPLSIEGGMLARGSADSTVGYNVVDADRELGFTAAGHTVNFLTEINGVPRKIEFVDERYTGDFDFQWHKQGGGAPFEPQPNKIRTPAEVEITSTVSLSSMMVDQPVCKYGITSFSTCSIIEDTNALVRLRTTPATYGRYVRTKRPAPNQFMARPGDSGGPVYSGNAAFGVVAFAELSKVNPNFGKLYFMPVERFTELGISVITQPFAIGSIPNASGPMNTPIPISVGFNGFPRFPLEVIVQNISCPPDWDCFSGTVEFEETAPPPLAFTFTCQALTPGLPTAVFGLRTKLKGADDVETASVDHQVTCVGPSVVGPSPSGAGSSNKSRAVISN